jgi:hypothetical protein
MRLLFRVFLVGTVVASLGAGCSMSPAPSYEAGHPVAPPEQPTKSPMIPPNAQNVPRPSGY